MAIPRPLAPLLSLAAASALVALQFLPWSHAEGDHPQPDDGASFGVNARYDVTASTWERTSTTEAYGSTRTVRSGWYDGDTEGHGVGLIRAGLPLLAAATGGAAAATAMLFCGRPRTGALWGLASASAAVLGGALVALGVSDAMRSLDATWRAGPFVAAAAVVLLVAAALAARAPPRPLP